MSYSHYGEIGDLWKHIPLCSFLSVEYVTKYIESNAAFPLYRLNHTAERNYGIFTLLAKSDLIEFKELKDTPYLNTLIPIQESIHKLTHYLGSSGLAMKLLGTDVSYVFCDIESKALEETKKYADLHNTLSVETIQGDSIDNLWDFIEKENQSTFLHIDPYRIFDLNESGRSYFDIFVKSMTHGVKTMLWYGYETKLEQKEIYEKMVQVFEQNKVNLQEHRLNGIEIEIESIGEAITTVNPGVPGCGVLIANLSIESIVALQQTSDILVSAYKNVNYLSSSGSLNKRVTFKN
ncbi:23S rRNA (adenine(2030)-N(6))-methyltransferase RlmJ [Paenibacillus psychroresistens]|uniref:23S rRNA (Adenine(2030)-N(6))-methyltransferase RlmJ n=1 Tax=Paenibacillus psychroresistens TaxID=1778678 RepID=A0A6B8RTE8_9BACL|nr:23S rRNA (adenine(2030)-N(6))-methyltransferase RlmJ [Paenibacillus psychroresistens]QGQ99189.1 23S rRNA (adenine(2030)-N(6))-methyltransferase RlmJ [Paenibacillus psychroresistens]